MYNKRRGEEGKIRQIGTLFHFSPQYSLTKIKEKEEESSRLVNCLSKFSVNILLIWRKREIETERKKVKNKS